MDTKTETIIAVVLMGLMVLLLNPFHLWMPDELEYAVLVGLVIVFGLFSALVWKEKAQDEREQLHSMLADRAGYLAGIAVLIIAIVYETVTSRPDPWLIVALFFMVMAKFAGLFYGRTKR